MSDRAPLILVVDDEASILEMFGHFLTRRGYRVRCASDAPSAMAFMAGETPDLVFTDVLMNPMGGLDLLRWIKREHPRVDVIVFTAHSSEDMVIEALRAGARDYLKKPFTLDALGLVADNVIRFRRAVGEGEVDLACLIGETKELEIGPALERITGVVNQLTANAGRLLAPPRTHELAVALYEVILNAIEHGNLEITDQEKAARLEQGTYRDLLEERRADPRLAARKISIRYRMDMEGLYFNIRDQGAGFDWRRQKSLCHSPEALTAARGRGLILAEFYTDRLEFNEPGNEVRLTMRLNAKEKAC